MKGKAVSIVMLLLVVAVSLLGCGGGGGSSSPVSSGNPVGNATVTGIVNDLSGNPVNGASVRMVLANNAVLSGIANSNGLKSARAAVANKLNTGIKTEFNGMTDSSGRYTFTSVPEGEYVLSAITAGGAQIVTGLAVRASLVNAPVMMLKPTGTISGKVTLNGKGASGSIVYAKGTSYASITDSSGDYQISGVPVATKLTLCVQSSEGTASEQNVEITDLNTRTLSAPEIALTPSTAKACKLEVELKTTSSVDFSKCVVFAVCNDGTTYIAPCKTVSSSNICSFKITHAGNYNIFPAYYDIDIASLESEPANLSVDITQSILQNSETLSRSFVLNSPTSVWCTIEGGISSAATGNYTVALYDENGTEYKKNVSAGGKYSFNNLIANQYHLVVYNDTDLYIQKNISLSNSETKSLGDITPVTVTPAFEYISTKNGYINCALGSLTNPASFVESSAVNVNYFVSVFNSDLNSYTDLYVDKSDSREFSFNGALPEKLELCTDGCSEGNNIICATVKVANDQNGALPFFHKEYRGAAITPRYPSIALSSLKQTDNVILFNTVTIGSNQYYVLVTQTFAYVFDRNGNSVSYKPLPATITRGNAALAVNSGSASPVCLFVQYSEQAADGSDNNYLMVGCWHIDADGKFSEKLKKGVHEVAGNAIAVKSVFSPNTLLAEFSSDTEVTIQSAFDCHYIVLTYDSNASRLTFNTNKQVDFSDVIAPCSYLTKDNKFCYLKKSITDFGSYIKFVECPIEGGEEKETTLAIDDGSFDQKTLNDYSVYTMMGGSKPPVFFSSCYDFNTKNYQVVLNNPSNGQADYICDGNNFLYRSDKVLAEANISLYDTRIGSDLIYAVERTSSGTKQNFKVFRAYGNDLIQNIGINMVYSTECGYLDNCIAVDANKKVHLLCADDGGNLQILIFNCY